MTFAKADNRPVCDWKMDADGSVLISDAVEPEGGCRVPDGFKRFVLQAQVLDKHGHILDGDADPLSKHGCDHKDTPEWRKEHGKIMKHESPSTTLPDTTTVSDTTTMATIASVGVPVAPMKVPEVPTMSTPMLMGLLSGAVSSAIMPALMNFLKGKLKFKKDKIQQEEKQENPTDCRTHNLKCTINQRNVKRELADLEGRLAELESKERSPSFEFSPSKMDDLVERVEKLEKKRKK